MDLDEAFQTVSLREAKRRLSELVDKAAAGEDVLVCRDGKPVRSHYPVGALEAPSRVRSSQGKGDGPGGLRWSFAT